MTVSFDVRTSRIYLISDVHIDSEHCDTKLFTQHLEMAKSEGAKVIIGGDLLDAMQSRHDPRRSMAELKSELKRDDYADALVEFAVNLLKPYAQSILALCDGNHETAIHRYTQSLVLSRIARELGVAKLPYREMIVLRQGARQHRIWYAHGAGSHNAQVTRGIIDVARQSAWIDCDVIWNGHTHTAYVMPFTRFDGAGLRLVWAIRTPSYLIWTASSTWHDERALPPQPRGCAVLNLDNDGITVHMLLRA